MSPRHGLLPALLLSVAAGCSNTAHVTDAGLDPDAAVDATTEDDAASSEDGSSEDTSAPATVLVMPRGDHVTLSPSDDVRIALGATASFTVTPTSGRAFSPLVRGTCPKGAWDGFVYTTGAIDEDCTVELRSVVPVLEPTTWAASHGSVASNEGPTDALSLENTTDGHMPTTTSAVATEDQAVLFGWTMSLDDSPAHHNAELMFFADGPEGRTTVRVHESVQRQTAHGTVSLALRAGYTFGVQTFDSPAVPASNAVTLTTLATTPSFAVTVSADDAIALSDWSATVTEGATPSFVVTPPAGVTLPTIPGGTCPIGSWDGARYTTGPITADCTVDLDTAGTGSPTDPEEPPSPAPRSRPNRAPSITLGHAMFFNTDPHLYTAHAWADVLPGPGREAFQHVTATLEVVATTGTLAFDTAPVLDPVTGTLYFATTPGTFGSATVQVSLQDDGGTEDGGEDTTTASFTIRVNTPPVPVPLSIRNPWRSPCVPVTMLGIDVDRVEPLRGDFVTVRIEVTPSNGFLSYYVSRPAAAGDKRLPRPFLPYQPGGRVIGITGGDENLADSLCYIPYSVVFHGSDFFVYRFTDLHGGTGTAQVDIDIFEN